MRTLDLDECAEFLKADKSVVSKLAGSGRLPGAKIGKAWVFLEDDLVEYLRMQVRMQMRERGAAADVDDQLAPAAAAIQPFMMAKKRGSPKRNIPPVLPEGF